MKNFYQKSVNKVKEALRSYWIDKQIDVIMNACENKQVYLIGVTNPNWDGNYVLVGENYDVIDIDEKSCIISSRIALKKTDGGREIIVDASVHCMEKDGEVRFFYMHMTPVETTDEDVMNVFVTKNQQREEKYREVIYDVFDVVLEYSCLNNTFKYNHGDYRKFFGMDKYYISIDQWFWSFISECVHPEDVECLDIFRDLDMVKRIKKGQRMVESEFRVKSIDNQYIWVKMTLIIIPNESSANVKEMYMLFKDINEEKIEQLKNKMLSRTDDLTLVWNRTYSEQLINQYVDKIKTPERNALMIIDIDDLKSINDTYGRMTGDYILSKVVENVLGIIEPKDVFGRFKADCFILFLSEREDKNEINAITRKILEAVSFEYVEKHISTHVHCSIGVAYADGNANTSELIKKCEDSLKEASDIGNTIRFA